MAVKRYSLKRDGKYFKLADNFTLGEFACKDGNDEVLVDLSLVDILQRARAELGRRITITSGYRTQKYNGKIGGAKNSYHIKGQAVDIKVEGLTPWQVALYFEHCSKAGGIGMYDSWVHVDTRAVKYRYVELNRDMGQFRSTKGAHKAVASFGAKVGITGKVTGVATIADNAAKSAHSAEIAELVRNIANKVQVDDTKALEAELAWSYNGSMYWVIKKLMDRLSDN